MAIEKLQECYRKWHYSRYLKARSRNSSNKIIEIDNENLGWRKNARIHYTSKKDQGRFE